MFNDDFEEDPFDDEDLEKERQRVKNLPIVKKANDLMKTIMAFMESVSDEEDEMNMKPLLFEDVTVINAKIRGAEGGDLYFIRMENAVLIKVHAVSIRNTIRFYEMQGIGNPEYLKLIINEIEAFRKIFIDWVATFKRTDEFPDEWGLF